MDWLKRQFVIITATGFYSGYSPVASGTAGSAVGVIVYYFLEPAGWWIYLAATIAIFFLGVAVSFEAEKIYNEKDDGHIVIDEIAGQLVTLAFAPPVPMYMLAGFLLFRFFDIAKPLRKLESLPGGWGVMADDLFAGLLAFGSLQIFMMII